MSVFTTLSCSFCDEWQNGSSDTLTTSPHRNTDVCSVINGSAATFKPQCFRAVTARTPVQEAPIATSNAAFSFTGHSACMPYLLTQGAKVSTISDACVPG